MLEGADGPVAGLVLAAGDASRFGDATKQLATLDGQPLVLHALAAARAAGLHPLVVVVGHDAAAVRAVLPVDVLVADTGGSQPQSASLRAGLRRLEATAVSAATVLLADEPLVDPAVVARVVAAWRRDDHDVVRARYRDRPGHPLVAARRAWSTLALVEGDQGARGARVAIGEVPVDADAPVDVDTPEDLARLRA